MGTWDEVDPTALRRKQITFDGIATGRMGCPSPLPDPALLAAGLPREREDDMTAAYPLPRCTFYLRTPAYGLTREPDHWKYTMLSAAAPPGQRPGLHTPYIPQEGQVITLVGAETEKDGVPLRVVKVGIAYPEYGSPNWPFNREVPVEGPMVTVIVEESEGLFTDEAPDEEVRSPVAPQAEAYYQAGPGIRPFGKGGRVRGIAQEVTALGVVDLHACGHDHAPGVTHLAELLPRQREAAQECAEAWLNAEMASGGLLRRPVRRAG